MKQLICAGATFVARTHATQVNHMIQMIERAMDHQGFSVIECLSECVEFFPGAFDPANPRKGGAFSLIDEKKYDNTPEDELRHDVTDELAAYKLAQLPFPGVFGVFYESDRPTKNALEKKWIDTTREKLGHASRSRVAPENVRPDEIDSQLVTGYMALVTSLRPGAFDPANPRKGGAFVD